jgi:hypothetical protein
MCFGTFILLTFIRDLGMELYFGGWGVCERKHKSTTDSRKGDKINHRYKKI